MAKERQLKGRCGDSVSDMCLDGNDEFLGATCWDGTVRVWRFKDDEILREWSPPSNEGLPPAALRCTMIYEAEALAFGDSLGSVWVWRFHQQEAEPVAAIQFPQNVRHGAIIGLKWWGHWNLLACLWMDGYFVAFDVANGKPAFEVTDLMTEVRVVCMDVYEQWVVIGTLRPVYRVISYNGVESKVGEWPMNLKTQVRCIAAANGMFIAGSVGGEVEFGKFSDAEKLQLRVVHDTTNQRKSHGASNALSICTGIKGELRALSAGSDGSVRVIEMKTGTVENGSVVNGSESITSVVVTSDGSFMIYAKGEDWSKGVSGMQKRKNAPMVMIKQLG